MTDFEKWCDNRAAEVCERWFPAEKQSPATVLFDLVKDALREAAEKAPREAKLNPDDPGAWICALCGENNHPPKPRALDEAELEKAFINECKTHDPFAIWKDGARYAARRNLMAKIEDVMLSEEDFRFVYGEVIGDLKNMDAVADWAFRYLRAELKRRLGAG